MSENYTDTMPLAAGAITTPAGAAKVDKVFSKSYTYQVYALQVCIRTAGAQAARKVQLKAGATVLAEVTTGTNAEDTVLEAVVADASVNRAAGEVLDIYVDGVDATLVAAYRVFGSATYC